MSNIIKVNGGNASGQVIKLITKNISENGEYNAADEAASGYSEVNVSVPAIPSPTKFRYIKWHITANGGQSHMQMSEFGFKDSNGNIMTLPSGYSASSSLPTVSSAEGVDKLFDGSTDTKMTMAFSSGDVEDIVLDLGSGNSIDITEYPYYYWCSGVDDGQYVGRNPQSWEIYGANTSDFSDGVMLDEVAYITQTRVGKAIIYQGLMVAPVTTSRNIHISEVQIRHSRISYSDQLTYSIGDYVFYNDVLYECIVDITEPEQWNSEHWSAVE